MVLYGVALVPTANLKSQRIPYREGNTRKRERERSSLWIWILLELGFRLSGIRAIFLFFIKDSSSNTTTPLSFSLRSLRSLFLPRDSITFDSGKREIRGTKTSGSLKEDRTNPHGFSKSTNKSKGWKWSFAAILFRPGAWTRVITFPRVRTQEQ